MTTDDKELRIWSTSGESYDAAYSRYEYILKDYNQAQCDRILIELLYAKITDLEDRIEKIKADKPVIKLKGISTGDVKDFIMILLNNGYYVRCHIHKPDGILEVSFEEVKDDN